jgi:hypothetical protein
MNSGSYNAILSLQNILSRCLDTKIFSSKFLKETLFLEPWAAARLIICLLSLFSWGNEAQISVCMGTYVSLSPLYQNKKNDNGLYSVSNPQNHLATSSEPKSCWVLNSLHKLRLCYWRTRTTQQPTSCMQHPSHGKSVSMAGRQH